VQKFEVDLDGAQTLRFLCYSQQEYGDSLLGKGAIKVRLVQPGCVVFATRYRGGGHSLVTEFRDMALNGLFCADVLRPLDLVPLTDFTYKYHPGYKTENNTRTQNTMMLV